MPDTVIFSDEDCDGLTSARITQATTGGTVLFQKWNVFGITSEDVATIGSLHPKTVYLLDLGSGIEMLTAARLFLDHAIKVVILDNHPPDPEVETPEAYTNYQSLLNNLNQYDNFYYKSTTESCTAGLAYSYFFEGSQPVTAPVSVGMMQRWAMIGLTGDVATDAENGYKTEGGQLFRRLLTQNPYLSGLFMAKADGADYNFGLLDFYARLLHVPRRIVFDNAPEICLGAMQEMEHIPNWIDFNRIVATKDEVSTSKLFYTVENNIMKTANPMTKMLLSLYQKWDAEHGKADGKGKSSRLHYPDFDVTILSSEWNLGSALAGKWSMINANQGHPKAQFVINDIPGREIHISGRGPKMVPVLHVHPSRPDENYTTSESAPIHIGKVFKMANPNIMVGGGLQPAGSAKGLVNDPEILLNELVKAVERSKA
jgi:hypothetical protein